MAKSDKSRPRLSGGRSDLLVRRPSRRSRAKTDEAKLRVRQAIIDTGRHLIGTRGISTSLRAIAIAAGYVPSSIYAYFKNSGELFQEIRTQDLAALLDAQLKLSKQFSDPRTKLMNVLLYAVDYWLDNPDAFDVLFSIRVRDNDIKLGELRQFGQSGIAKKSYAFYEFVVQNYLDSLPTRPCSIKFATEILLLATHGGVSIILRLGLPWSTPRELIRSMIEAQFLQWETMARS
jgi:AcrR family transcriptional regulator